MMNFFDLLERMDNPGAHYSDFGPFHNKTHVHTEEDLYEFELARLAARQVGECWQTLSNWERGRYPFSDVEITDRNGKIAEELEVSIHQYKGLSTPYQEGSKLCVMAKPQIIFDLREFIVVQT